MNNSAVYGERAFPAFRNLTIDTLDLGRRKRHVSILLAVDVTAAREVLHELKARTGEGLSFTGWVIKCVGQAVSEHKDVHALRKGGRRRMLYDDVDITVVVERAVGHSAGRLETLPMPYVVRKAQKKSLRQIHDEIGTAQKQAVPQGEVEIGARRNAQVTGAFSLMPQSLRYLLLFRQLAKDPSLMQQMAGTVIVTSIDSLEDSGYAWDIPVGFHPLVVALGDIARQRGVVGKEIKIREHLCMTILFDHDVTDGAPVVRFILRLKELLENGYGLVG